MALFDHRVFRVDKEWWAAQVHSASGAGWGDAPPTITRERVYFSSLTDSERSTVTAQIEPGTLNRLSHAALVRLLRVGTDLGHHFKMFAYNAPSAEELGSPICKDREGLSWVVRPSKIVAVGTGTDSELREATEFLCLDDSALRGLVDSGGRTFETPTAELVVEKIKSTFEACSVVQGEE